MIRRMVAIALTALSILFLFWPAMVSVDADKRDQYAETYKVYKEDIKEEGGRSKVVSDYTNQLKSIGYSSSDAKALANASITETLLGYKPDKSLSELRTFFSAMMTEYTIGKKHNNIIDDNNDMVNLVRACSILFNVFFWALLAAGIAAIALYLFNKTRAAGVAFAVIAVLNTIWVVILLVILKGVGSDMTAPGASVFLLPIFAIAACIVYQRDPNAKGLFSMRAVAPQPPVGNSQYRTQQTDQKPENPFMDRANEAFWTCPVCGNKNSASAGFCAGCGTKRQ